MSCPSITGSGEAKGWLSPLDACWDCFQRGGPCCFLFFSLVVKITPNYHRTLAAYVAAALGMVLFVPDPGVALGFGLISVVVIGKLLHSTERKESCKVGIVWKR